MESPEGKTSEDFIVNQQAFADMIGARILQIKSWADTGVISKDCFYESKSLMMEYAPYLSTLEEIDCVKNFSRLKIEFRGIDHEDIACMSGLDLFYMTSKALEENVKKRDIHMSNAYLSATQPAFGLIGSAHALGMQKEILSKLPPNEASNKFYFIHVYSQSPSSDHEASLRNGEINHPLGITLINSNEINEKQIYDLILNKIVSKTQSSSALSNLLFFSGKEICSSPIQNARDWGMLNSDQLKVQHLSLLGLAMDFRATEIHRQLIMKIYCL